MGCFGWGSVKSSKKQSSPLLQQAACLLPLACCLLWCRGAVSPRSQRFFPQHATGCSCRYPGITAGMPAHELRGCSVAAKSHTCSCGRARASSERATERRRGWSASSASWCGYVRVWHARVPSPDPHTSLTLGSGSVWSCSALGLDPRCAAVVVGTTMANTRAAAAAIT